MRNAASSGMRLTGEHTPPEGPEVVPLTSFQKWLNSDPIQLRKLGDSSPGVSMVTTDR